ncbi:hypothetical protein [Bdellovibrio reynosensis]|uniref:Uncharacterized protein n=1 Tax=Bdellovibrio reynosensis TaxID=2835041 RepID=A0ABY4CCJ3_9BACT|nr:hypothetical protein [Bdellovibrio reynosensis]UOF01436.1 hypothetical protein MNR06_00525 [Bdellovibrio reynosensis]
MHSRKIFTVLTVAYVLLLASGFTFHERSAFEHGGSGSEVLAHDPVKAVDEKLNALKVKVKQRMPASEKVVLIKEALSSIEEMRKNSPVMSVDKEIYMDYATESLEHVANDKTFSVKKCGYYKHRIVNDFEPYSDEKPSHPALLRSFNIVEGVCS